MPTVLITGCSSGFGRSITLDLLAHGWTAIATVRRAEDEAALRAAVTGAASARLDIVPCDITNAADVARLGQRAAAVSATLDGLVNNAGTAFPGPLETLPIADLRAQLDVNVIGHVAVTQAVLPLLRAGRGAIVNISSVGGRMATPVLGAYNASKFALEALSDALRLELEPFGVRVVVVQPGGSPTGIWRTSLDRVQNENGASGRLDEYAALIAAVRRQAELTAQTGFPPEALATLVRTILTTPRPRARYGFPKHVARRIAIARVLPDRLRDWLIRRALR